MLEIILNFIIFLSIAIVLNFVLMFAINYIDSKDKINLENCRIYIEVDAETDHLEYLTRNLMDALKVFNTKDGKPEIYFIKNEVSWENDTICKMFSEDYNNIYCYNKSEFIDILSDKK